MNRSVFCAIWLLIVSSLGAAQVRAMQSPETPSQAAPASRDKVQAMRAKAIAFLKASQADDGSFSAQVSPGVTALVAFAMLRSGVPATDPSLNKALDYLQKQIQQDGGLYKGKALQNYETCLAVMCFHEASKDGKYDQVVDKAMKFLRKIQWDSDEGVDPSDPRYGGQGYGSKSRPDLSNTGMFIDALEKLGTESNDPAMQEAIKFISRSQNLQTQFNDTKFAGLVNDGGFFYTPAGEGESKAGNAENGGLRSYASMTYVGFKSLLYAGVNKDDPRVKAARQWIVDHYTLEENPGVDQQGLYYYYHVFAKALAANGEPVLVDSKGNSHDWKHDMIEALAKRQHADGSWTNPADRWFEGDLNLVTGYCLLALSYCEE